MGRALEDLEVYALRQVEPKGQLASVVLEAPQGQSEEAVLAGSTLP